MTLDALFDRAQEIAGKAKPTAYARQRMAKAADEISMAGDAQAHLNVCLEAMAALIGILYAIDSDQRPANIDAVTYRILVPLPWGSAGYKHWNIRRWEAGLLRKILMARATQRQRNPPLFDYNDYSHTWHVSADLYPNAEAALTWLQQDGPSLKEWRNAVETYRAKEKQRKGYDN